MLKARSGLFQIAVQGGSARWRSIAAANGCRRCFHGGRRLDVVKPFLLADIGEGIKEVQIIQWFVQPGARVEQFDKICEVQSDKASVDITSRFDGVIKKLHYEADSMAQVGKPLLDIDITGDIAPQDEKLLQPEGDSEPEAAKSSQPSTDDNTGKHHTATSPQSQPPSTNNNTNTTNNGLRSDSNGRASHLATPAVRGLLKENGLDITDIQGTGKDGRVLKEDVHAHVAARQAPTGSEHASPTSSPNHVRPRASTSSEQQETRQPLTNVQAAMFRAMTKSLSIPHFLCADEVDLTTLTALRKSLNASSAANTKLSALAFVVKAVSLSLHRFPILNSRLDTTATSSSTSPHLISRSQHNIGIAMDTPQGLLVPNIKDVASLSVLEIAQQLQRLQSKAQEGKLAPQDLQGGTISISNIGSIAGSYATPLLVESEVAILAVGRAKPTPVFNPAGELERRELAAFSWSADHRVIDGATLARMGREVRGYLEEPSRMLVSLR